MDGEFARATTDIDLLAQGIGNDIDKMKEVFFDIFSVKLDDPLRYDLDSLSVKSITEFKDYHAVRYRKTDKKSICRSGIIDYEYHKKRRQNRNSDR